MTTEEALLAAVLANPADDLPRLVYADWLEENGQAERAEFIRVQIAGVDRGRQESLLDDYAYSWFPPPLVACLSDSARLFTGPTPGMVAAHITRGFTSKIACTLADWCGTPFGCERCGGTGHNTLDYADGIGRCLVCMATGHAAGIGPEVVRRHPVERVVLVGVVTESTLPGLSIVTQDSAGELFAVAFPSASWPTARRGHVEGSRETLERRISAAALLWAKSQPHPARILTSPVSVDFVTG